MRPTADGNRFRASCGKPVIDFTAWSNVDLHAGFPRHPDTRGQFRLDQVQPGMVEIKLPAVPRDLLRGTAALAALSLSAAQAQRTPAEPVPTEQAPVNSTERSGQASGQKAEDGDRCRAEKESIDIAMAQSRRPRICLSWRFPFVHKARRLRGKVRVIGCPSF